MLLSHIPAEYPGADTFFPFINPNGWHAIETRHYQTFTAVKYWRK